MMKKQSGIGLIEVLITLIMILVGMLGFAALLLASVNDSYEADLRTQASAIAEDFASRVRANIALVAPAANPLPAGFFDSNAAYVASYAAEPLSCEIPSANCASNNGVKGTVCTPPELIAYDLYEICTAASTLLPDGEVRSSVSNNRLTVGVFWNPPEGRRDLGQQKRITQGSNCAAFNPQNSDAMCVTLEVIP